MKTLTDYTEQAQNELFKKTNSIFAFSQKQFEEQKKEGIKYISIYVGLICDKTKVDELLNGLDEINKKGIEKDVKENGNIKIIKRAYFNYESQISRNTQDARESLENYIKYFPQLFTNEILKKTFSNCFKLAIKNDWF